MPSLDQLVGRGWQQSHAILLLFDFFRNPDNHPLTITQPDSSRKDAQDHFKVAIAETPLTDGNGWTDGNGAIMIIR